jgi:hypothetical protein
MRRAAIILWVVAVKLKNSLFSLFTITLLSFGGWLTILFNVDPTNTDQFTFALLYICSFLFLVGLLTFIGFGIRILLSNREIIFSHFVPSLRQACLLSVAIIGLLFLQSLRVLSVIDAGAFVLAILLLELFFRAKPKHESIEEAQ